MSLVSTFSTILQDFVVTARTVIFVLYLYIWINVRQSFCSNIPRFIRYFRSVKTDLCFSEGLGGRQAAPRALSVEIDPGNAGLRPTLVTTSRYLLGQ